MNSSISLFTILLFLLFSCHKTTDSGIENEYMISNSDIFEYNTGIGGDEEQAEVIQHPTHLEISEIMRNANTNWTAVYRYKPPSGFKGSDYVEIKLSTGSDGAGPNTNVQFVKLKFQIQ